MFGDKNNYGFRSLWLEDLKISHESTPDPVMIDILVASKVNGQEFGAWYMLRFTVVDKNPSSTDDRFGIDAIDLIDI